MKNEQQTGKNGEIVVMEEVIEQQIITAVRKLLTEKLNKVLGKMQNHISLIEFSTYKGSSATVPVITLVSCERTEKERVILQDAYILTITFIIPECAESELYCYTYAAAVGKAVFNDRTLGGVVDRAEITGKNYYPPKKPHCGQNWELVISLRLTVEGMAYAG